MDKNYKSNASGGGGGGEVMSVRIASTVTGSGATLSRLSGAPPARRVGSVLGAGSGAARPTAKSNAVRSTAPPAGQQSAASTAAAGAAALDFEASLNATSSGGGGGGGSGLGMTGTAGSTGSRIKPVKAVTTKITATPVSVGSVTLKPKLKASKPTTGAAAAPTKPGARGSASGKSAAADTKSAAGSGGSGSGGGANKKLGRISSAKFDDHKTADPFASANKKFKTAFALDYSLGRIPCRINHGSVKHKLQWDQNPAELDYSLLLPSMADGLSETEHPYVFVARTGFKEMLLTPVRVSCL